MRIHSASTILKLEFRQRDCCVIVQTFGTVQDMDHRARERIMELLRPYAANWSGSLGRGDLVIPQREIPQLVSEIVESILDVLGQECEATETELFHVLRDASRLPSLQDQVGKLRESYKIVKR